LGGRSMAHSTDAAFAAGLATVTNAFLLNHHQLTATASDDDGDRAIS